MEVLNPLSIILFNFFFNFIFNRALFSRSGAVVRLRYIQSVIGPLNRGSIPKKQHFIIIFFLILVLIGHYSVVQVLWFDIEIFKV